MFLIRCRALPIWSRAAARPLAKHRSDTGRTQGRPLAQSEQQATHRAQVQIQIHAIVHTHISHNQYYVIF
jgi:hypothetical protein